jgi:hypothetical protein
MIDHCRSVRSVGYRRFDATHTSPTRPRANREHLEMTNALVARVFCKVCQRHRSAGAVTTRGGVPVGVDQRIRSRSSYETRTQELLPR